MPFYAVRKGRIPGIYLTWKECEAQVKGYPYPSYRKFDTLEEAENFIGEVKQKKIALNDDEDEILEVWCDGSAKLGVSAGCGIVIVRGDEVIEELAYPLEEPYTNSHGEVQGAIRGMVLAVLLAKENEKIVVNSDSEFVVKTLNVWGPKRGKNLEKWDGYKYAEDFILGINYMQKYDIKVKHVPAHVGLRYNEMADALSRKGAGLK